MASTSAREESTIDQNLKLPTPPQIRKFLKKVCVRLCLPMRTFNRNGALNLSYGFFVKGPKKMTESYEIREGMRKKLKTFIHRLYGVKVDIFTLPCCWSGETGYTYFIGFCVVPFSWETRGEHLRVVRKTARLQKFWSDSPDIFHAPVPAEAIPFKAPEWYDDVAKIVHENYMIVGGIHPDYATSSNDEDSTETPAVPRPVSNPSLPLFSPTLNRWQLLLVLPSYFEKVWVPILDGVYAEKIQKIKRWHELLTSEVEWKEPEDEEGFALDYIAEVLCEKLEYTSPGRVWLPSDCASCS